MSMISVIIPVYNVAPYLRECLDSLVNQTYKDFEAICINDGSTDDSLEILEEYQKKDQRIKVFSQSNQGQAVARNLGLDKATGEYVFFLDSDDKLHKQAIELFYKTAKKTDAPIVVSTEFIKLSKKHDSEEYFSEPLYNIHRNTIDNLLKVRYLSSVVWNKLYKIDVLKNKRFEVGFPFEDWAFITTLFSEIPFYVSINSPVYYYNNLNVSTVRSPFSAKKIIAYMTGVRNVYDYYHQSNKENYWSIVRRKRIRGTLQMVLSKIIKSKADKYDLAKVFFEQWNILAKDGKVSPRDLSLKSLFRFYFLQISLKRKEVK